MGIDTSAWLIYGIQVPDTPPDAMEELLKDQGGVRFLHAGPYDDDRTFLATEGAEHESGDPATRVRPQDVTAETYARWDAALRRAARAMGADDPPQPGWLLTANED